MNQIGRKLYYELSTGNIIVDTGEKRGYVVETTWEQDFEAYVELSERVPETVGCMQLGYGAYAADFQACDGFKIDIASENPSILFAYPNPDNPDDEMIFRKSLSEEIEELKSQNAQIILTLVANDLL